MDLISNDFLNHRSLMFLWPVFVLSIVIMSHSTNLVDILCYFMVHSVSASGAAGLLGLPCSFPHIKLQKRLFLPISW
jgi:hypothetical protein